MRNKVVIALMTNLGCFGFAGAQSNHPCANKESNREMRECYAAEQARANAQVDLLVDEIASSFRKDAQDSSYGPVVDDLLIKAASSLIESQKSWRNFRDQHCRAVEFSFTTGSGAGTAYEACMLNLAQQRVKDLRNDFGPWKRPSVGKTHK